MCQQVHERKGIDNDDDDDDRDTQPSTPYAMSVQLSDLRKGPRCGRISICDYGLYVRLREV